MIYLLFLLMPVSFGQSVIQLVFIIINKDSSDYIASIIDKKMQLGKQSKILYSIISSKKISLELPKKQHISANYTIFNNYLIPRAPKYQYMKTYLKREVKEYQNLEYFQIKYKLAELQNKQIAKLQDYLKQERSKVRDEKQEYERIFDVLNHLPRYYHMLAMLFPYKSHHQIDQSHKVEKFQYHYHFLRLHPSLRKNTAERYEQIHKKYRFSEKFKQMANRLPIFCIQHPYQYHIIQTSKTPVPPSEYYLPASIAYNMDKHWQELSFENKRKYQKIAVFQINQYMKAIEKIGVKIGLAAQQVFGMIERFKHIGKHY